MRSSLITVVMAACTSAPNSLHGTVNGQTIAISDAISAVVTMTDTMPTMWDVIVLGSSHTMCADVGALVAHANQQFVFIAVADVTGTTYTPPTAPGTFTVSPSGPVPPQLATFQVIVD